MLYYRYVFSLVEQHYQCIAAFILEFKKNVFAEIVSDKQNFKFQSKY